ncbi:MAG: hypothetical protein MPJ50_15990 [Pirellulales bacterium]|nr:hypothetical protein [Pirellulales bacterium]
MAWEQFCSTQTLAHPSRRESRFSRISRADQIDASGAGSGNGILRFKPARDVAVGVEGRYFMPPCSPWIDMCAHPMLDWGIAFASCRVSFLNRVWLAWVRFHRSSALTDCQDEVREREALAIRKRS